MPARKPVRRTAKKRRPNPARRAIARAALTHDAVGAMGGAEINKRLDALAKESSGLVDELIAQGRGSERYSETSRKTDPLSLRYVQNSQDASVLRDEIARRYGPGAPSRLPRGFGPTKRARNPAPRRRHAPASPASRQRNPTASGEPIVVTAHFVEGGSARKTFKTLAGAQKYAQGRIGAHPDMGGSYAVDNYGSCKITVSGTSLRSLFPTHEEIAAAAPKQKWPCHVCQTPTDKGYMVEDGEWESDGWGGSKLIRQDYFQSECTRCTRAEKAKHAKWLVEQKKRQDAINRADRQAAAGRPPKGWLPF